MFFLIGLSAPRQNTILFFFITGIATSCSLSSLVPDFLRMHAFSFALLLLLATYAQFALVYLLFEISPVLTLRRVKVAFFLIFFGNMHFVCTLFICVYVCVCFYFLHFKPLHSINMAFAMHLQFCICILHLSKIGLYGTKGSPNPTYLINTFLLSPNSKF